MTVVDSSVAVAGFASWHELHDAALAVLADGPHIPGHAALETYSVLTRLPPPTRGTPRDVTRFLDAWFPAPYLTLAAESMQGLLRQLSGLGIAGGSTYDAVIAAVAREHGDALVTCDRRALPTYERLGVAVSVLE